MVVVMSTNVAREATAAVAAKMAGEKRVEEKMVE